MLFWRPTREDGSKNCCSFYNCKGKFYMLLYCVIELCRPQPPPAVPSDEDPSISFVRFTGEMSWSKADPPLLIQIREDQLCGGNQLARSKEAIQRVNELFSGTNVSN